MAITLVGCGTIGQLDNGTITPGLPAGIAAGDILVYQWSARGNGLPSAPPTGYTLYQGWQHTSSGINLTAIYWRVATGSESAQSIGYSGGAAGHTIIGAVYAFRDVDPTTPFLAPDGALFSSINTQNIGAITGITIQPGNAVLVLGHKADDCTSVATLSGDGLTWTEIHEFKSTLGNDATLLANFAPNNGASPVTIASKTFAITGGGSNFSTGIMLQLQITQTPFDPVLTEASRMMAGLEPQHVGHMIASY